MRRLHADLSTSTSAVGTSELGLQWHAGDPDQPIAAWSVHRDWNLPGLERCGECAAPSLIGRFDAGAIPSAGPASHAVPGAPSNLQATVSGNTITLTWTAASGDPTTYVIEAGSAPGFANLANFATDTTATSFTASLVPSGTYYVRVRARNSAGTSAVSNEVTVIVGGGPCTTRPNAPTSHAVTVSGNTVTLSWAAPSTGDPPTSYILEAGTSSGASNAFNADIGNVTRLTATAPNGTFFTRVRATNACGVSGPSNEVSFTVGPPSSLTGRWIGLAPDGMIINDPESCEQEMDIQLDIVQTGNNLSGTGTSRVRRTNGRCGVVGRVQTKLVRGTVNGAAVLLIIEGAGEDGDLTLSLTVTGNRMAGNGVGAPVTFAVTRQ